MTEYVLLMHLSIYHLLGKKREDPFFFFFHEISYASFEVIKQWWLPELHPALIKINKYGHVYSFTMDHTELHGWICLKKKALKALKHVIMNLATTKYVVYCGECIGHMARHLEARRNVDINHFYITKLGQKNLTSKLNFN